LVDPNVVSPQLIEFLAGIATGYLTKEGENILKKSTDKIFESLKKKLGKDEFEKIKGMETPEAKSALEALIRKKHLRKEVHAFYVIYRYLEKFTEDSQFLRVMDFRRGEGIPLDRMYVKLQIVEEQKKKDQLATSKYYEEDYYYQAREKWRSTEEHSRKVNPDEIMALDKGVVCILGLPGAGKTTLCKYFCWKTLKGDYAKQRFPIYIELRGIEKDGDPVTYALHSKLKEHFTKEEIEEAVATIKHNTDIFSPLYVFDGLDEVKVEYGKISGSIRNCADSSLCIVTSRRSGFIYLQHDRTYEILPLGKEEKEELVKNYSTQIEEVEKVESFLHVLEKREYDSLSKNPLLLSILCALASDTRDVKTLPSRRSGLYKRIVVKMNEWHKSKGGKGLSQEEIWVLEDLALSLFRRKRPRVLFEEYDINEKTLRRATEVGLIYRWNEVRYSFLHLTLHEYFAARSLRCLKMERKKIVREKKDVVSWHEILQLFASILSEEEEYKELKEFFSIVLEFPDVLYLNYALAGHCLAEVDKDEFEGFDKILGKVFRELEKNICNYLFIEAFVHLGARAVDLLLNLLQETDDNDLKRRISDVLCRIGDPRAIDPLLVILQKTDNDDLKWSISYDLGKIGERAVDPLLNLLQKTTDNDLKRRISGALGEIGDPRTIDSLLAILQKTTDNDLKLEISGALGEIGDPRAIDPLLNLLKETDDNDLKLKISGALSRIGDPRAVNSLLDLLQKTDKSHLKRSISYDLGRVGERAVDPLLNLLQKTDKDDLIWSILNALGKIGDPRAIDPLLNLLKETDNDDLKLKISDALSRIGDPRAVNSLLDLLHAADNNDLKLKISYALGMIEDPRAVNPLLDLLHAADNNDLKRTISSALGKIGDPRAIDPLLNLLKETENGDLKWSISNALGMIGDPRAVDSLLDLLQETDDSDLKCIFTFALGEIGDPRAVDSLLVIFQKTDNNDLIWSISYALGNFNPLHFYPFMENQILKPAILNVLCRFSIESNLRFFKDKVVLPEGDILYIKTEAQRKKAIKKLDKILKKKK
jgi:HEAT repeat protein